MKSLVYLRSWKLVNTSTYIKKSERFIQLFLHLFRFPAKSLNIRLLRVYFLTEVLKMPYFLPQTHNILTNVVAIFKNSIKFIFNFYHVFIFHFTSISTMQWVYEFRSCTDCRIFIFFLGIFRNMILFLNLSLSICLIKVG